ncbi:hypothetical protein AGMMS49965_09070 [Bacteroidia bacterium]|nr:hypothetical protein AGMMS49965_09070 [Bacteroidia bacterium]
MKQKIALLTACMCCLPLFGQMTTTVQSSAFTALASEQTPFWLVNHNWGVNSLNDNNLYLRAGVFHAQKIDADWSFEAGLDGLGGRFSAADNTRIQQLYGRLDWKKIRLDIGAREDYTSFLNPHLSSGDMVNSNNARPVPQIKMGLNNFVAVPYAGSNFFIKGDFAVGKYLDSEYLETKFAPSQKKFASDILSHNKSIYFRFGDIQHKHRQQFMFGLVHAAQWGGTLHRGGENGAVEPQPRGIGDFLRVVLAKEGSAGASATDRPYVAGSQWGAWLFKYDVLLGGIAGQGGRLSVHAQHFFDDGSGMTFYNWRDNLLAVEWQSSAKSLLSGVVAEFVYTKHQSGSVIFYFDIAPKAEHPEHHDQIAKGNGKDNYYNNSDYAQGPSHYGKTLGSPLLLSPEYNTDGSVNFKGNRLIAYHLGIEGYFLPEFRYRLLLTGGQNWGRYDLPFKDVHAGFASGLDLIYHSKTLQGIDIQLSMGADSGRFFGASTRGAALTVSKQFSLSR